MADMFAEYEELLTVDEACEALRLGHNMLYALLKRGALKGYRCGRIWRIPKAALVEYVREQSGILLGQQNL